MKEKIPKSKILVLASIVAVTFVVSMLLIQDGDAENVAYDGPPKAAIIDQLYDEIPNEIFHQKATTYLEAAGYEVDIFTTQDVTLGFYKTLPEKNYKIVVVRTHGVTDPGNEKSLLFTGERYTEEKYISEQLLGKVERAAPLIEINFNPDEKQTQWVVVNDTYRYMKSLVKVTESVEEEYFAIGPKFVKESMSGKFSDTIFLLGGCSTVKSPSLAESLLDKGASFVAGWDDTIGSADNDAFLLDTLRFTLENEDFASAVDEVKSRHNTNEHYFPGNLQYFT